MLRTAESVTPQHPDKLCDRISDRILDKCLRQDPASRVAVEVMGGHGLITVTGEITAKADIDFRKCVREIVGKEFEISLRLAHQSPEIAKSVDKGGAGDQGVMIGYACDETPELMPLEYQLARSLCQYLFQLFPYDGKTQITVNDGIITDAVASMQKVSTDRLRQSVAGWLKEQPTDKNTVIHANPTGDWQTGGFAADSGLTGRKIVIDSYGPRVPVGGGCFSGKDPTKVDRSAAYMARKIAVNYLKKHRAHEVYAHLAYVIGQTEPVQATVSVDSRPELIEGYDLTPKGIIALLELDKPIYEVTASWGHFGRGFAWDK